MRPTKDERTDKVVADLVAFDEGPALDYPLYIAERVRAHGFGRFVFMSAALAFLIAFTGLQVAQSRPPATGNEDSVSSGLQTMSAAELVQLIKIENRTVYWLKAKPGDLYTNTSTATGSNELFYRPLGTHVSNLNQFDINVNTYADFSTYESQPRPLLGANARTTTLHTGATITYNSASPQQAVVQFLDRAEVVVLNYPAVQALPTMFNDAENLVPIS